MRAATPLAVLFLVCALLAGCGDADQTTTSPPSDAASKQEIRAAWEDEPRCKPSPGASRWGCSVGSYRCQGVVTGRGWSISCAKPGRSVAFTVKPRS